jgi:hypothetical protein
VSCPTTFRLRFPTTSIDKLKNLQPDARVLVIISEAEAMLIKGHQIVFEGCF